MNKNNQEQEEDIGLFPVMLFLFSLIGGFVTILSAINIVFDLESSFTSRGTSSELPNDWDVVLLMGILFSITFVIYKLITRSKAKK